MIPDTAWRYRMNIALLIALSLTLLGAIISPGPEVLTARAATPGLAVSWGSNIHGELGNGQTGAGVSTPGQVTPISSVVGLAAGNSFSLAVQSDGTVWAWGTNSSQQLGLPATTPFTSTPVEVTTAISHTHGPPLSSMVAVAAGGGHSLALRSDGTVWAWGANNDGQLGRGTVTASPSKNPTQVTGLINVTAIAAGDNHSLALRSDGTVWAWGDNSSGQLGLG